MDTIRFAAVGVALVALSLGASATQAADYVPPGGRIAYALDSLHWAIYQPKDGFVNKQECPDGVNIGPRAQFEALFPDKAHRTVVGTRLRYESDVWFPTAAPDQFVFHEGSGPIASGMNLDGKIGPNDFTSPEGEKGIDNQLYRVLGCIASYRPDDNANDYFDNDEINTDNYNRILIELTGVESLMNSPHVEVTVYRGLESLMASATGSGFVAGGTQQIDTRWGRKYIQHFQGKIIDGVLTTEPHDFVFPWATLGNPADEFMHAARFQLKLTPTAAEGLIGGYTDIETWYLQTNEEESTHHQGYGELSAPSLYKAFRRLADAYPDPKTGANTAISSALRAQFVQVFILHPENPALEASSAMPPIPYAGSPSYPRTPEQARLEQPAQITSENHR